MHICIAWTAPSHSIVNWTVRNNPPQNINHNSNIFIHENALENVVCEMASILSRPQCVNCQWNITGLNKWYESTKSNIVTAKQNRSHILWDIILVLESMRFDTKHILQRHRIWWQPTCVSIIYATRVNVVNVVNTIRSIFYLLLSWCKQQTIRNVSGHNV